MSTPPGQQPGQPPSTPSAPPTSGSSGSSKRSGGSARSGRRERQRITQQPSFLERHRTAVVIAAALAGVVLISVFVLLSSSQPAYACSTIWSPAPTASPSPGSTPALGYNQPIMSAKHVAVDEKVTYTYCAPASGPHNNKPPLGPIPARVYAPNDVVVPQGWIHNLEHGGFVILYKGDSAGATTEGQAKFKAYFENFPPIPNCAPVIARFDQMSSPFQALVWGRVLLTDTFDPALASAFYTQWAGLTNPEAACPVPNSKATPVPSGPVSSQSAAPSGSVAPADSPVPSGSAAPGTSPSSSPN